MRPLFIATISIIMINIACWLLYVGYLSTAVYDRQFAAMAAETDRLATTLNELVGDLDEETDLESWAWDISNNLAVYVATYDYHDPLLPADYLELADQWRGKNLVVEHQGSVLFFGSTLLVEFADPPTSIFTEYLPDLTAWLSGAVVSTLIFMLMYLWMLKRVERLSSKITSHQPDADELSLAGDSLDQLSRQVQRLLDNQTIETEANEQRLIAQRDLLHGVAHELRSPMARVEFAIELMMDAPEQEQPELKEKVNEALRDLDDLVKEILSYSRLKHGPSELTLTPVNVAPMLQSALDTVQVLYPGISFEIRQVDDMTIRGDEHLLKRALINLLRNAGRFGKSRCELRCWQAGESTFISVEDDGNGIPPGKRDRIFEPFTRLDASRSRDSGGCGLGLAIVESIVDKHHGSVSVSDSVLGGALFTIQLR